MSSTAGPHTPGPASPESPTRAGPPAGERLSGRRRVGSGQRAGSPERSFQGKGRSAVPGVRTCGQSRPAGGRGVLNPSGALPALCQGRAWGAPSYPVPSVPSARGRAQGGAQQPWARGGRAGFGDRKCVGSRSLSGRRCFPDVWVPRPLSRASPMERGRPRADLTPPGAGTLKPRVRGQPLRRLQGRVFPAAPGGGSASPWPQGPLLWAVSPVWCLSRGPETGPPERPVDLMLLLSIVGVLSPATR